MLAAAAIFCLFPRLWRLPPKIPDLWGHYGMRDVVDVDHVVIDTLVTGYDKNRRKLYRKAAALMIAVAALAVETTALALYVL